MRHKFTKELQQLLRGSEEDVQRDQERRLRQAIRDARKAPFYAKHLAGLPENWTMDDFRQLPELHRTSFKTRHDELLNPETPHPPVLDATGGSTAVPTQFYRTHHHKEFTAAVDQTTAHWVGGGHRRRTVVLWGALVDTKRLTMSPRRLFMYFLRGGNWVFNCFSMDRALCDKLRRTIEIVRPHAIRGYRSTLLEFCRYLDETGPLKHTPDCVLSAAELLLPESRAIISRGFRAPVFDRYGSREMGLAAAEHTDGRMYSMMPSVHLEVVSPKGINVPGESGYLLVTTLNNRAMPLIRYRIGDHARWEGYMEDSMLPLPVISMTHGRETDMVSLPGGKKVTLIFFIHNLGPYKDIQSWQLYQSALDKLELRLAPANEITQDTLNRVQKTFSEFLGPDVDLTVARTDELQKNKTGKVGYYLKSEDL